MITRENPSKADVGALSTALAALVAADAPALRSLDCARNGLGEAGLATIVEALPRNRHLQELDIYGNDASDPFVRVLRTFLADHASLRKLDNRDLTTMGISANDTRDPFERMLRLLLAAPSRRVCCE
jgi:Ran GTPase-activating protein (RanGAP) involved in mRNA processing and transport